MNPLKALLLSAAFMPGLAAAKPAPAPEPVVLTVPGFADFLAIDGDTVWATNRFAVEQWSLKGKRAETPMNRPCGGMSVDYGSLWVADCPENAVKRIDIKTGKLLAAISTGIANNMEGELNTVTGAGSAWIASDASGKIARIDASTNTVVATIPTAPSSWYLTFGLGALWAVSGKEQLLSRIDPATNTVTGTVALGKMPGFLVAGEGAVWVQEQGDGTVAKVDPATMTVTMRIKVGDNLKYGDIDVGDGKVWLRTTDDQEFVVIDAQSGAILSRVGKPVHSGGLRWTVKGAWTSAHDFHLLTWWPKGSEIAKP